MQDLAQLFELEARREIQTLEILKDKRFRHGFKWHKLEGQIKGILRSITLLNNIVKNL